jgi:hypothetical protein
VTSNRQWASVCNAGLTVARAEDNAARAWATTPHAAAGGVLAFALLTGLFMAALIRKRQQARYAPIRIGGFDFEREVLVGPAVLPSVVDAKTRF